MVNNESSHGSHYSLTPNYNLTPKTQAQYESGNFDIYNRDTGSRGFGSNDSSYMNSLNRGFISGKDAMDDDDISSCCSEVDYK
jgi:hypothetical protein